MSLIVNILDTKELQDSQWLLCKTNLLHYLTNLKPSFYEYIIQRKIVKNRYLNTIINTILNGEPLPIITLTSSKKIKSIKQGETVTIDVESIEILDGLQRTFRLWAYFRLIQEYKSLQNLSAIDFSKKIRDKYPEFFDSGIITLTKVKEFYKDNKFSELEKAFENFEIYFFVWTGLTTGKVIHKMLVLNAGQRPVSLTHQYELLFLHVWEEVKNNSRIKLYRERDPQANKIKKGERNIGEYMFSSVIAGLRSYLENRPKRLSIDDLELEDLQYEDSTSQLNEDVFTKPYIETFLNKFLELDKKVTEVEKEDGTKWFVRDTTISGLLAGLGKFIEVQESMPIETITEKTNKSFDLLFKKIGDKNGPGYNLTEFQKEYYNLQSRTVNVGTFVRVIIMEYTIGLLKNENPSWKDLFSKSSSKKSNR